MLLTPLTGAAKGAAADGNGTGLGLIAGRTNPGQGTSRTWAWRDVLLKISIPRLNCQTDFGTNSDSVVRPG